MKILKKIKQLRSRRKNLKGRFIFLLRLTDPWFNRSNGAKTNICVWEMKIVWRLRLVVRMNNPELSKEGERWARRAFPLGLDTEFGYPKGIMPDAFKERDHYFSINILSNLWMLEIDDLVADGEYFNVMHSPSQGKWYGVGGRAVTVVQIGDRVYDKNYKFNPSDFGKFDEVRDILKSYIRRYRRDMKKGWCSDWEEWKEDNPIEDFIPYRLKGSRVIENSNMARHAVSESSRSTM